MRGRITRGKTIGIVISLLAASFMSIGQTAPVQVLKDHTFTTHFFDYEALGINPANIAAHWRTDKKVSFGLMSSNFLLYSRGIKSDLLHGGGLSRLSEVNHWLDEVLIERNAINFDNTVLGLNVNTRKAGCFAFSLRNNVYMEMEVNGVLEDLDFEGADFSNIADIIMEAMENYSDSTLNSEDESYIKMNMVNEINMGYSRKVVNKKKWKLFAGANLKYLMGFADLGLEFNGRDVAGYYSLSSLLPEGWEDENIVNQLKSEKKFGHGFGSSIGVALKADKVRAGLSVIDLGFIKWPSKRLYITQQEAVMEALTEDDVKEAVNNVIRDNQRNENGTELLPAKMILGASYDVHKYVCVYMDFASPLVKTAKGMNNPTIGAGTWLSLRDYLTVKTGATLVTKKLVTLPLFISFFGGKNKSFELSIGTSDMLSFFKENREYVNLQTALMKFHF
ncbi:MAG TPA: DUF5723 family protein [Chitinophagales bacterium]|nr:DUF5723 family protein [Chitinophagales bacterium]